MANMMSMKCPQCGAEMLVDDEHEFFYCDFCGSKQALNEADDVKLERLRKERETAVARAQAEADVEKKKIDTEYQLKKDEIMGGVESIKSGVDLVAQGANVVNQAKGLVKLAILFGLILLAIPVLIVGCIIVKAIG